VEPHALHPGHVAPLADFRLPGALFVDFLFQPRLTFISFEPGADFRLGVISETLRAFFHFAYSPNFVFFDPATEGFFSSSDGQLEGGREEREKPRTARRKFSEILGFLPNLTAVGRSFRRSSSVHFTHFYAGHTIRF